MANKIEFGLSNAHYAVITGYDEKTKEYTYGTVKPLPGAVSLTMDAEGDKSTEYADNIPWYTAQTNAGYSGSLELKTIPDDFRKDILGEEENADGVMIESADAQGKEFAFMFQIEGSEKPKRGILWRCSAGRPSIDSKTKEDKTESNTLKIDITAMARENDHRVKGCKTLSEKGTDVYENWFKQVYEPNAVAESGGEAA